MEIRHGYNMVYSMRNIYMDRGVLPTLSTIYNGEFLPQRLTATSHSVDKNVATNAQR